MFGLTRLLTALSTLADILNALAGTVAEVNAGLRMRVGLDGTPAETAAIAHQPERPSVLARLEFGKIGRRHRINERLDLRQIHRAPIDRSHVHQT